MDFQSLSRRDLQALCKKNRIPANMTNVAMVDALQALQVVEGIVEIQESLKFQSPKKAKTRSPDLPRTGRRTSVRRGPVQEEPKEQQASPLPRARRVTAKASEIVVIDDEGGEEGSEEKSKTPETCNGPKTRALSTRRMASKKEGEENQEVPVEIPKVLETSNVRITRKRTSKTEGGETEAPAGIPRTPATRNGCRASVRRVAQTAVVEEKEEKPLEIARSRRTRQSSRKEAEEMMMDASANAGKKSTRAKKAVKMGSLDQESEEQEGKDITGATSDKVSGDGEIGDPLDQKKDSDELPMEAKGSDATFSQSIDGEACEQDLNSETEGDTISLNQLAEGFIECQTIQESLDSTPEEENQEFKDKNHDGEQELAIEGHELSNAISVSQDSSPIRGVVCLGHDQEKDLAQDSAQQNPCIEITKEGSDETPFEDQQPYAGSKISNLIEDHAQDSAQQNPCIEITKEGSDETPIEDQQPYAGSSEENMVETNGEEEETKGCVDLNFHPQEPPFYKEIPAEIEEFDHDVCPVNQTPGDSSSPRANFDVTAEAKVDITGDVPAIGAGSKPETFGSDGSEDHIGKEEDNNLDLLLTGYGDDVPSVDEALSEKKESGAGIMTIRLQTPPESDSNLKADSSPHQQVFLPDPTSDAARSVAMKSGEVALLLTSEVSDLYLSVNQAMQIEVKESSDDEGCHDLTCEMLADSKEESGLYRSVNHPVEIEDKESGDDEGRHDLTCEMLADSNESGGNALINNQIQPESKSILDSASSLLVQVNSPEKSMLILDAAQIEDLTGDNLLESKGSGAISNEKLPESESIINFNSSPLLQSHSPDPSVQSSDAGGSPVKPLSDLTASKICGSGLKENRSAARSVLPVGIYREGREDDDKENNSFVCLTGGGEAKVKAIQQVKDLNGLSLRKLKAIYKEEVTRNTNNNEEKLEWKRTALTAINDNRL